ncbi:sterigmatocystin biosynthesis monooxygenase-like protein 1 [Elsinoe australis]|uniref:Sterigmatocystin biosynthesis monooxygenase-like protein 1 n=1 Tax=Elsinoe australis TaxID=40998 RepID=A0A4U7B4A3_9PEZI|nr:sterigmatocystin biosynthesis monooxygenase-like protein 1 [Elsinoe australis]
MAPDLNSLQSGGKVDYSTPGSSGYTIPDVTYGDPSARPLRIITIGAGVSGILNAYLIQKNFLSPDARSSLPTSPDPGITHVVYEKNTDIGGTWLENRYPGCACDIPSHAYTYNFALNPDWPRFFSYSPDIWKYLDKVCEVFDLRKYMKFETEVVGCHWSEDEGEWVVKLRQTRQRPGGNVWERETVREFEDRCHLLLHASGILNNFKWPDIPGLKDKFRGRVLHTARWDEKYQEEQWKEDRVAVIGSGASSVQTVPKMVPHVKHMDIFVRTGVWFVIIANNSHGTNEEYEEEKKTLFRTQPKELVAHAKDIEDQVNGLWGSFYEGTEAQEQAQQIFRARMAEFIKDERLLKGFTPNFGLGCRRITPGDPYMMAIQKENVDVHFTAVKSCTEDGVVGEDGVERKVDTVVCATGFDVSYKPRFPIVGKGGVDLKDKWGVCPEGYLGLGIPDMPNFITYIGPTWPVENGSVMGPLQTVGDYTMQVIRKMQKDHIKSWVPRQDITDRFNEHAQEWIKYTVWKHDCRSWYKNNDTGRVNAVWPGSSLHYMKAIETPRWEDFEIKYEHNNPWASLGMGWTLENRAPPGESDPSPYMKLENIDPEWARAVLGERRDSAGMQK